VHDLDTSSTLSLNFKKKSSRSQSSKGDPAKTERPAGPGPGDRRSRCSIYTHWII